MKKIPYEKPQVLEYKYFGEILSGTSGDGPAGDVDDGCGLIVDPV